MDSRSTIGRPVPLTLSVLLLADDPEILPENLKQFNVKVASTWPVSAVCQVAEDHFRENCEGLECEIFCLLKESNPLQRLNYNLPVITYFQEGDVINAQCEIQKYEAPKTDAEKLPVTIITGFLGSGKTTLMNRILHEQKSHKFFIIQNEFGEVSIDDELVKDEMKSTTSSEIISLDNGCLCCTVRGDLTAAFTTIMKGLEAKTLDVDAVLIETTGMADPRPVITTFQKIPNVQSQLRLDCIVTVAAANHITMQMDRKVEDGINEAVEQVIVADRIILNKLDLIDGNKIKQVKSAIRSLNPYAKILPATQSKIDLNKILNVQAFNLERLALDESMFEVAEDEPQHGHGHDDHGHGHDDHGHGHSDHGHGHSDHGHGHSDYGHDDHGHGHSDHGHDDHGHGHDDHGHGHDKHEDMDESHGHGHGHDHGHGHGDDCEDAECTDESHNHGHGHGKPPSSTVTPHSSGITSVGIQVEGEVNMQMFQHFFQQLEPENIYRTKGILKISGAPNKFVFHGVHDVMDFNMTEHPWGDGPWMNKVVFIGRKLDREEMEKAFRNTIVKM